MVAWLKSDKAHILITHSFEELERLRIVFPEVAKQMFTWKHYLTHRENFSGMEKLGIDNMDIVLECIFGSGIDRASLNNDTNDMGPLWKAEQSKHQESRLTPLEL